MIFQDTARTRENIQKSLAGSSGPGASSRLRRDHNELVVFLIASLEVENESLQGMVRDLQQTICKLEAQLSVLEKSMPAHWATDP